MEKLFCTLKEGEGIFGISAIKLKLMAQAGIIPACKAPMSKKWLIDIEKMKEVIRQEKPGHLA